MTEDDFQLTPYVNVVCIVVSVSFILVSAFVNGHVSPDNVAVIKKTEFTKKTETQSQSPSKRSVMKPAVRQTRPTQHHSCPRRRPTGDLLPRSVTQVLLSAGEPPEHRFLPHLTSTVCFFLFVFGLSLLFITIKMDCRVFHLASFVFVFFCAHSFIVLARAT